MRKIAVVCFAAIAGLAFALDGVQLAPVDALADEIANRAHLVRFPCVAIKGQNDDGSFDMSAREDVVGIACFMAPSSVDLRLVIGEQVLAAGFEWLSPWREGDGGNLWRRVRYGADESVEFWFELIWPRPMDRDAVGAVLACRPGTCGPGSRWSGYGAP